MEIDPKNLIVVLAIAVAALACPGESAGQEVSAGPGESSSPSSLSESQQAVLLAEVISELDSWNGGGFGRDEARFKLNKILMANPRNVQARVELARYTLKAGHGGRGRFSVEALEGARRELDTALEIDENSANALILLGYVHTQAGNPEQGIIELQRAEAIGTSNWWLDINLAQAFGRLDQWDKAERRLEILESKLARIDNPPLPIVNGLTLAWHEIHQAASDIHAMTDDFGKYASDNPTSAHGHGDYASHLLLSGDVDRAIVEAESALALAEYPAARYVLGLAQYVKWAQLREQDLTLADEYLAKGQRNLPEIDYEAIEHSATINTAPYFRTLLLALRTRGYSLDRENTIGRTSVLRAVIGDRVEWLEWLIDNGASIDIQDHSQRTPLMVAMASENDDMVRLLIERGADLDASDNSERRVLHLAVNSEDLELTELLISHDANLNLVDSRGETPLAVAVRKNNLQMVKLLVGAGADVTVRPEYLRSRTLIEFAETAQNHCIARSLRSGINVP